MSSEELLDTQAAAQMLRIAASTLEKKRVYGGGPRFVKISRSVRYRPSDLSAWVAENLRQSTSVAA